MASKVSKIYNFKKLNGTNYNIWYRRISYVLIQNKVNFVMNFKKPIVAKTNIFEKDFVN